MRLICSLSPVDGWNGADPVFKKAKNFKTSFVFGFLPPTGYTSENTSLRSTMIFGFRQSSPSKFVNHFKKVNKKQCLLTVSKNGYYFAFGDNINNDEVYIASNLDFSNSFETPLTEQNCLFEIEVVNDKCHVIIHNGELTTDPIYFDHAFDCPYYNPDTEDGSGYIGYGIGAYTGMFGNIDLTVLYDNKYKETATKEYVDHLNTEARAYTDYIVDTRCQVDQQFDSESEHAQSGIAVSQALNMFESNLPSVDQTFNSFSTNPQSGIAVAEAIKSVKFPIKTYDNFFSDAEQTQFDINLVTPTGSYYVVYSVNVRNANGEEILCDVDINDSATSGSEGVGDVTVRLSEPMNMPVIIRILYSEGVL